MLGQRRGLGLLDTGWEEGDEPRAGEVKGERPRPLQSVANVWM